MAHSRHVLSAADTDVLLAKTAASLRTDNELPVLSTVMVTDSGLSDAASDGS